MSLKENSEKTTVREIIENYLLIILFVTMILVNLLISFIYFGDTILKNTGKLFVGEGIVLLIFIFGVWNIGGSPVYSNRNNPGTVLFMVSIASLIVGLILFIAF
jgi:hypothetical protein